MRRANLRMIWSPLLLAAALAGCGGVVLAPRARDVVARPDTDALQIPIYCEPLEAVEGRSGPYDWPSRAVRLRSATHALLNAAGALGADLVIVDRPRWVGRPGTRRAPVYFSPPNWPHPLEAFGRRPADPSGTLSSSRSTSCGSWSTVCTYPMRPLTIRPIRPLPPLGTRAGASSTWDYNARLQQYQYEMRAYESAMRAYRQDVRDYEAWRLGRALRSTPSPTGPDPAYAPSPSGAPWPPAPDARPPIEDVQVLGFAYDCGGDPWGRGDEPMVTPPRRARPPAGVGSLTAMVRRALNADPRAPAAPSAVETFQRDDGAEVVEVDLDLFDVGVRLTHNRDLPRLMHWVFSGRTLGACEPTIEVDGEAVALTVPGGSSAAPIARASIDLLARIVLADDARLRLCERTWTLSGPSRAQIEAYLLAVVSPTRPGAGD